MTEIDLLSVCSGNRSKKHLGGSKASIETTGDPFQMSFAGTKPAEDDAVSTIIRRPSCDGNIGQADAIKI